MDKVFLRPSISVNSRTLTYSGMDDFGGEIPNREDIEAEHFTQPVVVFACKRPVKSIKYIILAIYLLAIFYNEF